MPYRAKYPGETLPFWLHASQVMSDPSGGAMFVADPKKPVGGHVIAHSSTVRLSLRKGKAEQRLMKVVDSPNLRARLSCHLLTLNFVCSPSELLQFNHMSMYRGLHCCVDTMHCAVRSRGGGVVCDLGRRHHRLQGLRCSRYVRITQACITCDKAALYH